LPVEYHDVESVAMGVADENVAGVGDVDAVRVAGDRLPADAPLERAIFAEHHHGVAFEVTHKELVACEPKRKRPYFKAICSPTSYHAGQLRTGAEMTSISPKQASFLKARRCPTKIIAAQIEFTKQRT